MTNVFMTTVPRSWVPSLRSVTQLSSPEAGDVTAPALP